MKWHTTIFWSILTFLLLASVGASFVRFKVDHDYLVSFKDNCNPTEASCFVDCNDDLCTKPYYYIYVERSAKDVKSICPYDDISLCMDKLTCDETPNMVCKETFCDPAIGSCSDKQNIE